MRMEAMILSLWMWVASFELRIHKKSVTNFYILKVKGIKVVPVL